MVNEYRVQRSRLSQRATEVAKHTGYRQAATALRTPPTLLVRESDKNVGWDYQIPRVARGQNSRRPTI